VFGLEIYHTFSSKMVSGARLVH